MRIALRHTCTSDDVAGSRGFADFSLAGNTGRLAGMVLLNNGDGEISRHDNGDSTSIIKSNLLDLNHTLSSQYMSSQE